jgi:TolB-like protein/Tfp pilus assembly protein PilF
LSFDFGDWLADLRRRQVFRVAAIYAAIAWGAVEVSDIVVPATGMPDWVLTTVVILAMLGFPVAVVLAWVFDVGKDGIVRAEPGSATGILTIVFSLALLFVGTAGMVWLLKPGLESGPTGPETVQRSAAAPNSVAVLPFENLSADPDNAYFVDGLTDTLLHMLAGVEKLKVAARTSSFAFRGQDRDIRDIADAIGVSHVLEGSVQRDEDRIRVTAQLIRADDGYHVWSRNFDAQLEDIFTIQDEIAGEVAGELVASMLAPGERPRPEGVDTTNVAAYDLYLQAMENRQVGGIEAMTESILLLRRAVVLDSDFQDARTELALHLAALNTFQAGPELEEAVVLLDQVLVADPEHVKARALRTYIDVYDNIEAGDFALANQQIREIEQLFAAAPEETDVANMTAYVLQRTGQPERALAIHETLLENDPLNVSLLIGIAEDHEIMGQFDQARAFTERALEINPDSPAAHAKAAKLAQHVGDDLAYVRHMARASELAPLDWEIHANMAVFLYNVGLVEEGDRYLDKVLALAPNRSMSQFARLTRAVAMKDGGAIYDLVGERLRENSGPECCGPWDSLGIEVLIRQAALDERLPETMVFIDEHRPGFSDLERFDIPLYTMITRVRQVNAIRGDRTLETMNAFLDQVDAQWRQIPGRAGRSLDGSPRVYAAVLVMRGEVEAAADVVLEGIFSDARIHFQDWREYFAQPCFEELVQEPRVRAALERWDEEERQLRQSARELLKAS